MIWSSTSAEGDESFENFKKAVDEYVAKTVWMLPEEQESEISQTAGRKYQVQSRT